MKDYAAMSDFEINKSVADIAMNGTWHVRPSHPDNDTGGWLYGSNGIQTHELPDYCNNPADAWPIISENKISTMWMTSEKEWCAWAEGDLEEGAWCWENVPDFYHCGESQLRAAMIVFLMMREGE